MGHLKGRRTIVGKSMEFKKGGCSCHLFWLPSKDLTLVSQNTFLLPLTGVRINLREQRFIIYIYLMPDDACGSKTLRENFH